MDPSAWPFDVQIRGSWIDEAKISIDEYVRGFDQLSDVKLQLVAHSLRLSTISQGSKRYLKPVEEALRLSLNKRIRGIT